MFYLCTTTITYDDPIYKVKSHMSQQGLHGWSLPQFLWHEVTESIASPPWMGCWSIAGLPPAVCCQYPFYTPGWRETMWGKVSCPRKQHDGRDWASNYRPSDLKSNTLTTTPLRPYLPLKRIPFFCSANKLMQ